MTQEKGVAETRWLDVNGHEFEQTPTDSGGPRSLVGCSPWGRKESNTTE